MVACTAGASRYVAESEKVQFYTFQYRSEPMACVYQPRKFLAKTCRHKANCNNGDDGIIVYGVHVCTHTTIYVWIQMLLLQPGAIGLGNKRKTDGMVFDSVSKVELQCVFSSMRWYGRMQKGIFSSGK